MPDEKTPLEKLAETENFTAVLKDLVKMPNEQYCPRCTARWYSCWCNSP